MCLHGLGLFVRNPKFSRLHPQATTPRAANICEKSEVAAVYLQTVEVTQVYERVVGLFSEDSGIPVIPAHHRNFGDFAELGFPHLPRSNGAQTETTNQHLEAKSQSKRLGKEESTYCACNPLESKSTKNAYFGPYSL